MQDCTVRHPKRVRIAPNLYQRTKDGRFEAGYTGPDGKWHIKTLPARNLTEAKRALRALHVRVDRGEEVAPSRRTLTEVAKEFVENYESLVAAGERSPRTLERYRDHLDHHILPILGRQEIQKVTPDLLARFLWEKRESGLAPWSCKGMLTPLGRIFALAVRRGYIHDNPLQKLDSTELPKGQNKSEARVLNRDELAALITDTPDLYRPVIATLIYTGLRIQEALGLIWEEVDFESGVLRVRCQLTRATRKEPARRVGLKTKGSRREVRLEPDLAAMLKKHKLASRFSKDQDYVFTTAEGTPFYYSNLAHRGLDQAAQAAGLNRDGVPKLSFHDLRHTYGSHLVLGGLDVVRVSRQLGHARPSITLDVYAHEFEQAQHTDDVATKLTAAFGGLL
jgi:integrase